MTHRWQRRLPVYRSCSNPNPSFGLPLTCPIRLPMRQLIRQPTEVLPSLQVVTNKSPVFIMDLQRGPGRAAVAIREPPQQLEMHIGHDRPYAFMKVTAPPVRVEAADRLQARDLAVFF